MGTRPDGSPAHPALYASRVSTSTGSGNRPPARFRPSRQRFEVPPEPAED
ncbi:AI-2E family transporter, partial [Kocuria tytonicola]